MEVAFCQFHTIKEVFFLGQAGNKETAKAHWSRLKLLKQEQVDEDTNAETRMASNKQHKINTWQNSTSHGIDVSEQLDAHFNILMIHLMCHWVEQIHLYGALKRYSAERHEQTHEPNLKDGWTTSNHNLNNLPQVMACHCRILCFKD
jgi:hypothetical protein